MMKLTYRGIKYTSPTQVWNRSSSHDILHQHRLSHSRDSNVVILIRPQRYYNYRGISYTKTLVFDTKTQNLLNIDRQ